MQYKSVSSCRILNIYRWKTALLRQRKELEAESESNFYTIDSLFGSKRIAILNFKFLQ